MGADSGVAKGAAISRFWSGRTVGGGGKSVPGRLNILVVEDHSDSREYLAIFLRQLGHVVREAGSMDEALDSLDGEDCDVLISDVGLPDGSGWDLLSRTAEGSVGYAITMSGFGTLGDRVRSSRAGYRQHLLKPFDAEKLSEILDEAAVDCPHEER